MTIKVQTIRMLNTVDLFVIFSVRCSIQKGQGCVSGILAEIFIVETYALFYPRI